MVIAQKAKRKPMTRKAVVKKPMVKLITLDLKKINDQESLDGWDRIWARLYELRKAISHARQNDEVISVRLMQQYEQARNAERQYFWDKFYNQQDDNS